MSNLMQAAPQTDPTRRGGTSRESDPAHKATCATKAFAKKGAFGVAVGKFKLVGEMRDAAVCSKKADYLIIVFQTNLEPDPRIHFLRGHLALHIHLLNSWLVQTIFALTASLRYDGALNADVYESQTICCFMRAFTACFAAAHRSSQRRRPPFYDYSGTKTPRVP